MEIVQIESYLNHGYHITPFQGSKLYLIEYSSLWKKDHRRKRFGSMIIYDYLDQAKALMLERYPNAYVRASIPDLVFSVFSPED